MLNLIDKLSPIPTELGPITSSNLDAFIQTFRSRLFLRRSLNPPCTKYEWREICKIVVQSNSLRVLFLIQHYNENY